MDAEYIAGLFVVEGHQGHGTGHQLISEVKRKNRLSSHAYEKNAGAVAFYQAEGFHIENSMTEKETGEQEYRMVFHESDESKESCSKMIKKSERGGLKMLINFKDMEMREVPGEVYAQVMKS